MGELLKNSKPILFLKPHKVSDFPLALTLAMLGYAAVR